MMSLYDLSYTDTRGNHISLDDYRGYVILIVNTATGCGLAPQFKELELLYQKYQSQRFVIIGFPSNQFVSQEPVSDTDMTQTCAANYGVSFPLSQKIMVNGRNTDPVFVYLKDSISNSIFGSMIKRNFTKFLIDREGVTIHRFAPTATPMQIESDILLLLA